MQHRIRKEKDASVEQDLEEGWAVCKVCGVKVKGKNLRKHMQSVHKGSAPLPTNIERSVSRTIPFVAVIVVIILLIAGAAYMYFQSPEDEGPDINDDPDWLQTYNPAFRRGSSNNDWWIEYPRQNPRWGEMPMHPPWLIDPLRRGPVIVFAHSDNCAPCIEQERDIKAVLPNYKGQITLVDMMSGVDPRAGEVFREFDPNGDPNYIPLTIVFTLLKDADGEVMIAWHGSEGATGREWLNAYIRDSIYYHQQNIGGW